MGYELANPMDEQRAADLLVAENPVLDSNINNDPDLIPEATESEAMEPEVADGI